MVIFSPNTPFSDFWKGSIAPALAAGEEEKQELYEQIIAYFEEANRCGAVLSGEMKLTDVL